jgi:DNA-binding NtrC family response regulator
VSLIVLKTCLERWARTDVLVDVEWQVKKVTRPLNGKHILIVEDDTHTRAVMLHVLLSAGYTVDTVGTATAALDKLDRHAYHLILTDDRLPDGRGVHVADVAREKGMDAVVVTGYMLHSARVDLERHEHLMKPVRADELVEAVDRHLEKIG